MGDLQKIFPGTSQLATQFLTLVPNIAAIPFVFIGGWIGTKFNNMKLLNWSCLLYGIGGALFFVAPNMITLILLSFLIGITAGIVSPLSTAFIADLFGGSKRTEQYGYTSAVLNGVLMISVIATGYLAKIWWRLPFIIYLLPFVPLFFAAKFKKYIKEGTYEIESERRGYALELSVDFVRMEGGRHRFWEKSDEPILPLKSQTLEDVIDTWPQGNIDVRIGDYMFRPHQKWTITAVPDAGGYLGGCWYGLSGKPGIWPL